ncbi:MAG: DUF2911 domain-containing protein [Hymenobacteraceae bacterium]|nr:DUF2911 domain-containing protein [Hymenobacteraceae bacterium]
MAPAAHAQEAPKRPDFPKIDKSTLDAAWLPRDAVFREKPGDPTPAARILYSRPQKAGRRIFGTDTTFLVPYGKVWRTGANENTELRVYRPITLGGKKLTPGTYAIYTVPGEKEWTIIISSDTERWGAYAYSPKSDVARIPAVVKAATEPFEAFSIAFRDDAPGKATLRMVWDTVEVAVPVTY